MSDERWILWACGVLTGSLGGAMQQLANAGTLPYWPAFAAYLVMGAQGVGGGQLTLVDPNAAPSAGKDA